MAPALPDPSSGLAGSGGAECHSYLRLSTKKAGAVKGECEVEGHDGEIAVHAWSWGVQAGTAMAATRATALRAFKHLVLRKGIDAASTGLLGALVNNDEVRDATLTVRRSVSEQSDYLRITVNGARIVNVDIDVDMLGNAVESVTLSFTKVELEYITRKGTSYPFSDEVVPSGA